MLAWLHQLAWLLGLLALARFTAGLARLAWRNLARTPHNLYTRGVKQNNTGRELKFPRTRVSRKI